MLTRLILPLLVCSALLSVASQAQELQIAKDATATKPLEKGQKIPDAKLSGPDGKLVALSSLHRDKPLVIVFFRGGWCPICTRHTQELMKVYPDLKAKGFEMVGVSPDSVESSKANVDKTSISFPIYSDPDLNAIRAFGLAFKVDDATVTKYKGFGIDLEKASGRDHHALPVPAIYVVGTDGVITFAHSDADYRKRLDTKDLLKALEK